MNRRSLTVLVIAVLAVLAIGFSAATLPSMVSPDGDGSETDGGPLINQTDEPDSEPQDGTGVSEFGERLLSLLLIVTALGGLVYLALYRKKAAAMILVLVIAVVVVGILLYFGDPPNLSEAPPDPLVPGDGDGDGESGSNGETDDSLLDVPPELVAALLGLVFLVLLAVLRARSNDSEPDAEADTGESDDGRALGAIAGRAADRIEDNNSEGADAENEIYRAWREMTTQLDIENGEATTPREFRDRAVDTGLPPDDVRELTDLFELVRYGGEDVTADREQRAVRVLRRIESAGGERE